MKKLSILCSSLLLALMMCFPVFASEDLRYVEDNADLLTVSEQQELNDTLTEISERQGVDVAIITTDDMGDQSIENYAKAKYNERGYGDDGALLVVNMEVRKWWMSTYGKGTTAISSEDISTIGSEFAPYLSSKEYADAFEQLVNGRQTYFGNILVTSKILFDEYASWLFSIFFEVAERIELETGEDAYHKRVFGFISEFLLLVWVTVKKLRVYECKVGMLGEKAETGELKRCLAECFRNRDVDLAKKIFLETREKRPDVLMEASDITGELHLCMQIIATAGEERNHGETMILERENDFGRLMEIFSKLNRVVSRYRENSESEEDIRFLGEGKISKTAVWVAVMMGKESESEKKDLMDRMLKYLH